MSRKSDLFDVSVSLVHETEMAWLVTDGEVSPLGPQPEKMWIPKSQAELEDNEDGSWTLTAPEWLLEAKGLI